MHGPTVLVNAQPIVKNSDGVLPVAQQIEAGVGARSGLAVKDPPFLAWENIYASGESLWDRPRDSGDAPTLLGCIERAGRTIAGRYATRIQKRTSPSFEKFFNEVKAQKASGTAREFEWHVCQEVRNQFYRNRQIKAEKDKKKEEKKRLQAKQKLTSEEQQTDKIAKAVGEPKHLSPSEGEIRRIVPDAREALVIAVAYWQEAALHQEQGRLDHGWASLLQCYFWLGSAGGPNTPREISAAGGSNRTKEYEPLRQAVLGWLAELPKNHFESIEDVIRKIYLKVENFKPPKELIPVTRKDPHIYGRTEDGAELLRDWSTSNDKIRKAFELLVIGGIKRGQKRKPKRQE